MIFQVCLRWAVVHISIHADFGGNVAAHIGDTAASESRHTWMGARLDIWRVVMFSRLSGRGWSQITCAIDLVPLLRASGTAFVGLASVRIMPPLPYTRSSPTI